MIQYEYETVHGQHFSGYADHLTVRYSGEGIKVLILDVDGEAKDLVDVVSPRKAYGFKKETTHFICDRFSINGKDLS